MGCMLLPKNDTTNWKKRKLVIFLTLTALTTIMYAVSHKFFPYGFTERESFHEEGYTYGNVPPLSPTESNMADVGRLRKKSKNRHKLAMPDETEIFTHLCPSLDPVLAEPEAADDDQEIDMDDLLNGDSDDDDTDLDMLSPEEEDDDAADRDEGDYVVHMAADPPLLNNSQLNSSVFESWKRRLAYSIPPFSPEYRNPCWAEPLTTSHVYDGHFYLVNGDRIERQLRRLQFIYSRRMARGHNWRLRCLPYFFIAGQPKCGTTDLYNKLTQHPSVAAAAKKESHWWTRKRYQFCDGSNASCMPTHRTVPICDYIDLFDQGAECIRSRVKNTTIPSKYRDVIVGEASASTFWDNDPWRMLPGNEPENEAQLDEPRVVTANYIHNMLPQSKIIVILRDPTQRLYSDYLYFRHAKSVDDFHQRVVLSVLNMEECIRNRSVRACVYDHDLNSHGAILVRLRIGMYSVFLRDWLAVFPSDQITVVRTEEYAEHPVTILNRLYHFLGLSPLPNSVAKRIMRMPKANRRAPKGLKFGPMLPETEKILRQFYSRFNADLADLLQDDGFLWA